MIANLGWKAMLQLNRCFTSAITQICTSCGQRAPDPVCKYCLPTCLDFDDKEINLLSYPNIKRLVSLDHCDGLSAVSWYRPPISHWLQGIKFHHNKVHQCALRILAHTLWQRFQKASPLCLDVACCLPLHRFRFIQRGYNQVEQIWQGLPLQPTVLIRNKKTQAQSTLSKARRKVNLRGAFSTVTPVEGKNILLLEDVITTGATMDAAAKACKQQGAKSVWAMSISLTPFEG